MRRSGNRRVWEVDSRSVYSGLPEATGGRTPKGHMTDGRRLRTERTRRSIVETYLELLRQNSRSPTAAEVADHAGCSRRTLFDHFPNLALLKLAVARDLFAWAPVYRMPGEGNADRLTRLKAHVEAHAEFCEHWSPLWRVLRVEEGTAGDLKSWVETMHATIVQRLAQMYEPELETLSWLERKRLLVALEVLTTFESWERMRTHHRLPAAAVRAAWIYAIDRMLPPTPPRASIGSGIDNIG